MKQENIRKVIAENEKVKRILFDAVVSYRKLTWCADKEYAIVIRKTFNSQTIDNISGKLNNLDLPRGISASDLHKPIKTIIQQMTAENSLNVLWLSQLITTLKSI